MKKLILQADNSELNKIHEFIEAESEIFNYDPKIVYQMHMLTEEIFINIASYAYTSDDSQKNVSLNLEFNPKEIFIEFEDSGTPYNPLKNKAPDTSLPVEKRPIGGLGILIVKHIADSIDYKYKNGKNILTIKKNV